MVFGSRVLPLSACLLVLGLAACNKGPSAPSTEAKPESSSTAVAASPTDKEFAPASTLNSVHFDFDKSEVRARDVAALEQAARWLKSRPEMMLQVTGHCDERGTDAYNVALGERRAQSVKRALTRRGIDAARVTTISYGEHRPLCSDHTEACWATNRRAEFLVKAQ